MKKTSIHRLFAMALLISLGGCEKKTEVAPTPKSVEEPSATKSTVEEVKEGLKGIAAKAEAEAKEVLESVKEATAENLEIAKEKVAEFKAEAAEDMVDVVEAADEKLDAAGATLKNVQKDAVRSLNNMLQSESE